MSDVMSLGTSRPRSCIIPAATIPPARLPNMASKSPSHTNCHTSRAGVAPKAALRATSRLRLSDRTSTRLATLTQAIKKRRRAPPMSVRRTGRTSPTMISERGTTLALRLRPVIPYCPWSCFAIAVISDSAVWVVTPSRSLPIPQKL